MSWDMLPQQCIQRQKRERERERLGIESERERGLAYATAAVYKSARENDCCPKGSQPPKRLSAAQKALNRPKGSQPSIVQTVQTRVHIGMQSF